ncbi:MAG: purine-nucleoside phosphorylase [Eubacterium sp.]|nr:purine-nucleoside phosphorylase [Eubacterium sp.]
MLKDIISQIRSKTDFIPEIAIVLGSGLGGLLKDINIVCEIPYDELEGMPVSTAPAHEGKFVFGEAGGKRLVIMCGRVHLYEGYSARQVATPIRVMRLLGAKTLILTNASGGINKGLNAGDLMLISDQISSFVESPLRGKNTDALGVRFPDMSNAYDRDLRKEVVKIADELGIELKSGVYCQLWGPQFETPAEIKMLSSLGADAVGMSTAVETVAAVHCGFKVIGISLIANLACGLTDSPLSSEEINEAGKDAGPKIESLIKGIIKSI